jgi:hypothetical protein
MGRSVPLKTPIRFQIANKINGFVHVSYGTALIYDYKCRDHEFRELSGVDYEFSRQRDEHCRRHQRARPAGDGDLFGHHGKLGGSIERPGS